MSDSYYAPSGYECTSDGVYRVRRDGRRERLTYAPCYVTARTHDGYQYEWRDPDGWRHVYVIPERYLRSGRAMARRIVAGMARSGLLVVPGMEYALLQYLAASAREWHEDRAD